MPSARFATAADRAAIRTHMTRVVGGISIASEMNTDFGGTHVYTNAQLDVMLAAGKILLGFDDGLVLRCVIWTVKADADRWEVMQIGADKRYTAQQRLTAMNLLLDWLTRNVAAVTPATRVCGTVKVGGTIDTFMTGKLPVRTLAVRPGFVYFEGSMADLQAAVA